MLGSFREALAAVLDRLPELEAAAGRSELRREAHRLVSAAGYAGAGAVVRAAQALEHAESDADWNVLVADFRRSIHDALRSMERSG